MKRMAVLLFSLLGAMGCDDGTAPACVHPCDLGQVLHVAIEGSEPAASLSVSGPCSGGSTCPLPAGCRSADFYLMPTGAAGPDSPDLLCHITAVSASGASMERDAIARYTDGLCCSGYEFAMPNITITF
jgi:hypothetical protein